MFKSPTTIIANLGAPRIVPLSSYLFTTLGMNWGFFAPKSPIILNKQNLKPLKNKTCPTNQKNVRALKHRGLYPAALPGRPQFCGGKMDAAAEMGVARPSVGWWWGQRQHVVGGNKPRHFIEQTHPTWITGFLEETCKKIKGQTTYQHNLRCPKYIGCSPYNMVSAGTLFFPSQASRQKIFKKEAPRCDRISSYNSSLYQVCFCCFRKAKEVKTFAS